MEGMACHDSAVLCFSRNSVYVCNLGDSRVCRLRNGKLLQLSLEHVEQTEKAKTPLTQHLGISSESFLIEPYLPKR